MAADASLVARLKQILSEDPRTAVLLLEILGPPPGLANHDRPSRSAGGTQDRNEETK
ncbi:hypothetical protein IH601_07015 [Candidatus Bipolaricaulota bacterium]|nr:hypothetical protein [Candidatus Bipolaricaulota bacterium]